MRKIAVIFLVLILAACGSKDDEKQDSASTPDAVTVQFSWIHEYSSAAFYAAEKNGHFADANLNVTLVEGGFGESGYIEPYDEVLNGNAQFGLSSGATLLQARAEGKPVVAVLAILQRSPFAVISLSESEIQTPQDLIGKTIAINDGGARQIYDVLLGTQNIDPDEVNTISRTDFGIDPLLNADVDAIGGWIINEGVLVQEAGKEPNYILLSDYGLDSYDFVVFTTQDMVDNNPDLVQRFVTAVTAGIQDVVSDPAKAIEFVHDYAPDLDTDAQLRRLEATIPLMNVPGLSNGSMQPEIWQSTYEVLVDQGDLDADTDVTSVYTLQFLQNEE